MYRCAFSIFPSILYETAQSPPIYDNRGKYIKIYSMSVYCEKAMKIYEAEPRGRASYILFIMHSNNMVVR
jgi:hypothetical protein